MSDEEGRVQSVKSVTEELEPGTDKVAEEQAPVSDEPQQLVAEEQPGLDWRGVIMAMNEAIDSVVGNDPRTLLKVTNLAMSGLIIVTCSMLGAERSRIEATRDHMARLLAGGITAASMEPGFVMPDDIHWYTDPIFMMWFGFFLLALVFVFILNAVLSKVIGEQMKAEREKAE
ncbi:MAG: hypothetical protein KVP17_002899 [Porospora cf. gigantea B]|uniref:uncharacterized protein n=2 Tax=Porospora cf. gigantea B TaxID=2853592 RepID=UPI003571C30B|nr:MAG: hypothetical protein KVP17_002899 [Porospora cf. gigantea B]